MQLGKPVRMHQRDINIKLHEPARHDFTSYFLLIIAHLSKSSSVLWEAWLEQHDLSLSKTATFSKVSPPVWKEQFHLALIIQDILYLQSSISNAVNTKSSSQHWVEVSINDISTRCWRWSNNLPVTCRWDRWGSNSEPVHPKLATLQYAMNTKISAQKLTSC